jgi:catechol 2,3-dioxygenase-like lactoylglutathione lyase family enzyme
MTARKLLRRSRHDASMTQPPPAAGLLHHVELWVPDVERAVRSWGWLLGELGYEPFQRWPDGVSFRLGPTYVVFERSPALAPGPHKRTSAGLNHLAFHAADRAQVDALTAAAPGHGWSLLFADRHPHAGGPDHYAAYLEDADGYEVELVAG